ncbi:MULTISPECIES: ABC transporter permease [unclassified Imperialibacter]|uniref:ABC transporter permease n=1 Tax=unclassified Imperialibacter TaxID=2629706 RepID=UPI0012560726|nr:MULTISPECIES: ABC transporter permease [unclassified Imperialibacter]CAD5274407.1 putative ABC transport system permease protein [Imperialibacter sp. 89]CAD5282915.1 putative ABC transport system permease protein [Imperialibacter sp. 75]VVT22412.1 putative ABC transport system permease protein [Imperialibacter sp. EC-SDR9]
MRSVQPPKYPLRFLRWFCREDYLDEIEGDLIELFEKRVEKSPKMARRRFVWDVVKSFRLRNIRSFRSQNSNNTVMLKNYLKVAWRNMLRQKMYSAVKVGGFAVGIGACVLISLFIRDELSYDLQYPDNDRIYRVIGEYYETGIPDRQSFLQPPLAKALKEDFPEVEEAGRFLSSNLFGAGSSEVRPAGRAQNTYEKGFIFADPEFFQILGLPLIYGDPASVLTEPNTLLISKSKAEKYFPGENPLGKAIILNNNTGNPYKIDGVFEDFPKNSHLRYDFIRTLRGMEFGKGEQYFWGSNNYHTYIKIRAGSDASKLEGKLSDITDKYILPALKAGGQPNAEEIAGRIGFKLQPVADIHLRSEGIKDRLSHGDIRFVWIFGAVAAFILLLAAINFINLSTAKSANRAKEVGLRKTLGSQSSNLISQFLTESLLFSFFSFMIGVLLATVLLPYFNELSGKALTMPWADWQFIPLLLAAAVVVGLLAGIYPAFYLSAFKPAAVLKGSVSRGTRSSRLRGGLVIFQFATSIILIAGTFIIYRQMEFILNQKIGFDKEQVLLIQGSNSLGDNAATFKNELLRLPDVKSATVSDYLPVSGTKRNSNGFYEEGKTSEGEAVYGQIWRVDPDYVRTMGMKMAEGRDFFDQMPSESQSVIINQTMAKQFGFEEPLGERITNGGGTWNVVGVLEDFHYESMKEEIQPLCLVLGNSPQTIAVKVTSSDMASTTKAVTALWDEFVPQQPIRYSFLDESYARMYDDLQRTGSVFTTFAILAVLVACLGLFGLSAFVVEQRGKEISIRKVLGAGLGSIFRLVSIDFLQLVVVAFIIATPISWYFMERWLEDYIYRIDITWDVFALAGLLSVAIALITISSESVKAAFINPVKKLRSE